MRYSGQCLTPITTSGEYQSGGRRYLKLLLKTKSHIQNSLRYQVVMLHEN